jgi:predicted DCC family thiol-disulfide oxidoreductase YuxK
LRAAYLSVVPSHPSPVLLYDGDCGFCARSVQFVLARETPARRSALRFAPLQGAFGQGIRAAHRSLDDVDSVVWYDPARDAALVRSEAGLAVLRHLGGWWRLIALLGALVPRSIRDAVYSAIARNRHRLTGEACLMPSAHEHDRFLP